LRTGLLTVEGDTHYTLTPKINTANLQSLCTPTTVNKLSVQNRINLLNC